jgi:hypothetical protein
MATGRTGAPITTLWCALGTEAEQVALTHCTVSKPKPPHENTQFRRTPHRV